MAYKIGLQLFVSLIFIIHFSVAKAIYERPGDVCVSVVNFHEQPGPPFEGYTLYRR